MEIAAIDLESRRHLVHQVLRNVADCAVGQTPFQRAISVCYDTPLDFLRRSSKVSVLDVAHRGLSEPQQGRVTDLLDDGIEISASRYKTEFQLGRSFFYPCRNGLGDASSVIPSSRRFLRVGGWQQNDVLLIPFRLGDEILGHVSVDDPSNGMRPTPGKLEPLEELASVAAMAIRDACSLRELSESHSLFRFLAESGLTGVIVVQEDKVRYVNEYAATLLGYAPSDLEKLSPWWSFVHPDDRPVAWQFGRAPRPESQAIRAIRRDGRVLWLSTSAHSMVRHGSRAVAIEFYDLTDRVARESELEKRALRDSLTGLMNRAFFDSAIPREIERSKRYKRPFTLMLGDLRRFKVINDSLGHQEGDRVLAAIANLLRAELRDSDWAIRYGGDEFLFLLPETGGDLEALVVRLQGAVERWSRENVPRPLNVGIDLGWSTWDPADSRPVAQILADADSMLYQNKRLNQDTDRSV